MNRDMPINRDDYRCWEDCLIQEWKKDNSIIYDRDFLNSIYLIWKTDDKTNNERMKLLLKQYVNILTDNPPKY